MTSVESPRAGDTTPEESESDHAFRAEARAFLEAHAKVRVGSVATGSAFGRTDMTDEAEAAHVQECRDWQATLADGGWAGITVAQ